MIIFKKKISDGSMGVSVDGSMYSTRSSFEDEV
jgi:hypothetical protein